MRAVGVTCSPRIAIRLLEHDGLLKVIPNKGAVVPEPSVGDVLEVYAMRAALGSLALHKVMLESSALVAASLEKELTRFKDSVKRRKSSQAADADLSYQSALVAGADLPRVARQFEQLTWQVRIFISAKGISYDDKMPKMLDELGALHEAIVGKQADDAEHLWRERLNGG